jgi:hypothetical protein
MKSLIKGMMILTLALAPLAVHALSTAIGRDINFPKNYDAKKAEALRKVIRDEQFKFVGGIVSYWPPDWGTRLSFEGDAASLNEFFAALDRLEGFSLRLILYAGRNDELRRDSSWQLDFSQARPGQVTIYLNLNSKNIDFYKIKLPEWPAR